MSKQKQFDNFSICGIVLIGTPHFRAGLAQWAILCANKNKNKEKNQEIRATAEEQDWRDYSDSITALTGKQDEFCEEFGKRRADVKIAYCFADMSEISENADQVSLP